MKRTLTLNTAILTIIATMIGGGILTTTRDLAGFIMNPYVILSLWVTGGVVAIAGALSYAELSALMPEAGGEYLYLRDIFGRLPAFLTGWISLFVGFSAPIATTSLIFTDYLNSFFIEQFGFAFIKDPFRIKLFACTIIMVLGGFHIAGVKKGSGLQNMLTVLKVLLLVAFIITGLFFFAPSLDSGFVPAGPATQTSISSLGLALLMVMFSYSGWNAATYLAGETKDPVKTLPKALFTGTLFVTALYVLINIVYLKSVPIAKMEPNSAIAALSLKNMLGAGVAGFFSLAVCIILLSAISAEIMIGPRVYYAMAKDKLLFDKLGHTQPKLGTPAFSILLQIALSCFYIFAFGGKTGLLMQYMGFALSFFPILAVAGLLKLHYSTGKKDRPYVSPLFPLFPLIFIILSVTMLVSALASWTQTSLLAVGITTAGIPVYYIWEKFFRKKI